jgi:pheromone shutdown protein TraB
LELCPNRVDLLFPPPPIKNVTKEKRGWFRRQSPVNCTNKDEEEATDGGEGGLRMGASLLSKMQAKYAQQMGVTIGGEFRTAYEESNEYSFNDGNDKCVVVLGDRPVRITLVRVWQSLSWFGKCKLLLCLLWSCIVPVSSKALQEWMDSLLLNDNGVDLLTKSIADLEKYFPSLKRVIIDERDLYMSCKLLQLTFLLNQQRQAQQQRYQQQQQQYQQYYHPQQAVETQEKGPLRIVAIVGAGHCPGMCRLLSNMTDQGSLQPANNYEPLLVPLIHTMSKSIDPTKAAELQELITGITVVQPDAISADAVAQ